MTLSHGALDLALSLLGGALSFALQFLGLALGLAPELLRRDLSATNVGLCRARGFLGDLLRGRCCCGGENIGLAICAGRRGYPGATD